MKSTLILVGVLILCAALLAAAQTHTFGALDIANTWTGTQTFGQQVVSSVATGTALFSIASSSVVTNLNAQFHNGLTAPGSAIVGISDTQTLTNKTLTSPVINGNPSGTGIPTSTLKQGTSSGNYTSTSTFLVAVDSTNLKYVVTIPTGWKLIIASSGSATTGTGVANCLLALVDGGTTLLQVQLTPSGAGVLIPFSLNWIVTGDGNSHTIQLEYATSNASDAATVLNSANGSPAMTFILMPSN